MNNDNVKLVIDKHLDKLDKKEQIMVLNFIYSLEDFREVEAKKRAGTN